MSNPVTDEQDDPILRLIRARQQQAAPSPEGVAPDEADATPKADVSENETLTEEDAEAVALSRAGDRVESMQFRPRPPRKKRERTGSPYSVDVMNRIMSADRMLPGVALGRACVERNVAVSEIAKMLKVSRPTVYGWFTGEQYPRDWQLQRIKTALLTVTATRT